MRSKKKNTFLSLCSDLRQHVERSGGDKSRAEIRVRGRRKTNRLSAQIWTCFLLSRWLLWRAKSWGETDVITLLLGVKRCEAPRRPADSVWSEPGCTAPHCTAPWAAERSQREPPPLIFNSHRCRFVLDTDVWRWETGGHGDSAVTRRLVMMQQHRRHVCVCVCVC